VADRLYRSPDDKVIAGVAGGLARHFDADPSIIRIIWAVAIIASGGLGLLLYIVMAIVVPYPPEGYVAPGAEATTDPTGGGGSTFGAPSTSRGGDGGRSAALILGAILVVIGGLFLIRELLPDIDLSISWPVISVILGIALIVLSIRPGRSSG
jgi:phage shock protein PspC (stress-responsive transcriptional regulator)